LANSPVAANLILLRWLRKQFGAFAGMVQIRLI